MTAWISMLLLGSLSWQSLPEHNPAFRWTDRQADSSIWEATRTAFRSELAPDVPDGVHAPLRVKQVERIGVFRDSVLVILRLQEESNDPYPTFSAYNFHLSDDSKSQIVGSEAKRHFPMWKLDGLRNFAPATTPDIAFTYQSCTECEATELLASFAFDEKARRWKLRAWDDAGYVWISSDAQHADEGSLSYECLHEIRDFTGDGFDDLAVLCSEELLELETEKILRRNTELRVYAVDGTRMVLTELDGNSEVAVRASLCRDKQHPLCHSE